MHELFQRQVARTPDAVALSFEGQRLGYAELNERANRLAHHLARLGVGPETRVAIFAERSLEAVVGFLGVLKAGAAYVPLEPDDPAQRIAFMLGDARAAVVLTQARLLERLPAHAGVSVCLDRDWPAIARERDADTGVSVHPLGLAYVTYTSGSTGRPKGAMNARGAVRNRLEWMQSTYRLGAADRVLQKTPFSFDVSGWELFWPLMAGAEMVLARPGGHKDPGYLVQTIVEREITVAHFVPSMLRLFLEHPEVESCRSLRQVIASGEELPFDLQQRFFERLSAELDNLYGPTEAAIDVSRWRCRRESRGGPVPIGGPVANTQLYVLDPTLKICPVGVEGELHIGGVQVGRGYHDRPALTAEKFIPDPFSGEPGARLYRTGDLAREREDGNLVFLGRIDHQVKVRGFRIELGEIDAVLTSLGPIQAAVTLAREYGPGDRRLVAYLVGSGALAEGELIAAARQATREKLPESMHPSAFVVLDALPLSPNGKIDRKALPAPAEPRAVETHRSSPSTQGTELEQFLIESWKDVLQALNIGLNDRFFEVGGNSLLAARVVNDIQKKLEEKLFVTVLFEAPTVAQLAAYLVEHYPVAVARCFDLEPVRAAARPALARGPLQPADFDHMRELVPVCSDAEPVADGAKNPRAIFVLSTHRSGTTLLRAMLAGHPDLFAASELQLLAYPTMAARKTAFSGKHSLWEEGALRAVMEIRRCDADGARRAMAEFEDRGASSQEVLGALQQWVQPRILVDKSPTYALDPAALRRAEAYCAEPLYIHLTRHPLGMIRSSADFHMEQIWHLDAHAYGAEQIAELVWTTSHRNILDFLSGIPAERQCRIAFEELTARPEETMQSACARLGLCFDDSLLRPYEDTQRKMLDGIHPESMPMGDTKFHAHRKIDASIGERWREGAKPESLADATWRVAEQLGYDREAGPAQGRRRGLSLDRQRLRRQQHRNPKDPS